MGSAVKKRETVRSGKHSSLFILVDVSILAFLESTPRCRSSSLYERKPAHLISHEKLCASPVSPSHFLPHTREMSPFIHNAFLKQERAPTLAREVPISKMVTYGLYVTRIPIFKAARSRIQPVPPAWSRRIMHWLVPTSIIFGVPLVHLFLHDYDRWRERRCSSTLICIRLAKITFVTRLDTRAIPADPVDRDSAVSRRVSNFYQSSTSVFLLV